MKYHMYVSFPSQFSLAATKEVLVAGLWDETGERNRWNLCFTRNLNDWKFENKH